MGDPYGRPPYPPPGWGQGPPPRQDHTFRNIVTVIIVILVIVIAAILVSKMRKPGALGPTESPSAQPTSTVTANNPPANSPPPAPASSPAPAPSAPSAPPVKSASP
jgi:hypothetical protein